MATRRPVHGQLKGAASLAPRRQRHGVHRLSALQRRGRHSPHRLGHLSAHGSADPASCSRKRRTCRSICSSMPAGPMDYGTPSKLDYARKLAGGAALRGAAQPRSRESGRVRRRPACRCCPRGAARTRRRRRSVFWRASSRGRADQPACGAAAFLRLAPHARPGGGDLRLSRPGRDRSRPSRCCADSATRWCALHVISAGGARAAAARRGRAGRRGGRHRHRARGHTALLEAYRETFQRHVREIEAYCRKYGWAYVQARTEIPFEDLLLKLLREEGLLR